MKIETILNAMDEVWMDYYIHRIERRYRQFHAFRARILRMDAEKDARIRYMDGIIGRKNADIEELLQLQTKEALIRDGDYWFNRPQPKKELHHD